MDQEGHAPKGASTSTDPELARKAGEAPNQDAQEYLGKRAQISSPEGVINAISELDNPGLAVMVTELQQINRGLQKLNVTSTIVMPCIIGGAIALLILTNRIK